MCSVSMEILGVGPNSLCAMGPAPPRPHPLQVLLLRFPHQALRLLTLSPLLPPPPSSSTLAHGVLVLKAPHGSPLLPLPSSVALDKTLCPSKPQLSPL